MPYRSFLSLSLIAAPTFLAADAPKVMTDFGPTHSIVSALMEGVAAPNVLLSPSDNPHHFTLRPSQARQISDADVVIWVGQTLTPWLVDPLANLAGDAVTLALLDTAGWQPLPARGNHHHGHDDDHDEEHAEHDAHDEHKDHDDHAEHEEHDDHKDHDDHAEHDAHDDHKDHDDHAEHEEHDDHKDHEDHAGHEEHDDHDAAEAVARPDPHAWLDPAAVVAWVDSVAATLATVDPDNAATYAANAESYTAALTDLGAEIDGLLQGIDGDTIILPHDSFQYLEARTGLIPAAYISDSDDAEPGPAHLRELREMVTDGSVICVLSDGPHNAPWVEVLLEGTDARTATLDFTDRAEVGYLEMMRTAAQAIADCAN